MLQPGKLLRLIVELAFVMLGLLLAQVAVMGQLGFDRRSPLWLGAAALVLVFGAKALVAVGRAATKWEQSIRGASLTMLGLLMLTIAWAPQGMVRTLLFAGGAVLIARGIASAILILRA